MELLYNTLCDKLSSLSKIKYIDLDKGQVDLFETRPAVSFPALLLGFQIPQTSDIGAKQQQVMVAINIRLVIDYVGNTSANTPTGAKAQSLGYFRILDDIHKLLQGWSTAEFNKFSRKTMREERRADGLKVVNITYTTSYIERA